MTDRVLPERRRALVLAVTAAVLEICLILPFVDDLADRDPTVHFTQHGLIFFGGMLMGIALRELLPGRR